MPCYRNGLLPIPRRAMASLLAGTFTATSPWDPVCTGPSAFRQNGAIIASNSLAEAPEGRSSPNRAKPQLRPRPRCPIPLPTPSPPLGSRKSLPFSRSPVHSPVTLQTLPRRGWLLSWIPREEEHGAHCPPKCVWGHPDRGLFVCKKQTLTLRSSSGKEAYWYFRE